jgi:serine/threonine protein kinase
VVGEREDLHERGIVHRDLKPSNVMVIERAGRLLPKLRLVLETSPAAAAALVVNTAHDRDTGPARPPGTGHTIVIVIDQLDELFTLCTSADERVQFAAAIAQLAASADAPIRVIGTVRDDFLMQLEALAPLRSALSPALVLLGNPSRDALVRIVVEPARRVGYALSDPSSCRTW